MQRALLSNDKNFEPFKQEAEQFMCRILPNSPSSSTQYTQGRVGCLINLPCILTISIFYVSHLGFLLSMPLKIAGGLMYKLPESNLQYVTAITSLLTTYSKYMAATKHTFNCGNLVVTTNTLRSVAKQQVLSLCYDYFLFLYFFGYGPTNLWQFLGGLYIRSEPIEDVIHGRVWTILSQKNSPQRILIAFIGTAPTKLWL